MGELFTPSMIAGVFEELVLLLRRGLALAYHRIPGVSGK